MESIKKTNLRCAGFVCALVFAAFSAQADILAQYDNYFTIASDAGASVSYSDMFFRYSLQANAQPAATGFNLLGSETGFTFSDAIDTFTRTASVGLFGLAMVAGL